MAVSHGHTCPHEQRLRMRWNSKRLNMLCNLLHSSLQPCGTCSNMAPVVAEATGAAVMALLLSVSPTMTMGDRQSSGNGALQPQQGQRLKVLAWGRRGLGSSSSSQVEVDPNRPPRSGAAAAGGGGGGVAEEATDYPKDRVVDDSWTHAAFRAFHEMRAGRPLSTLVLDEDDEEEEQDEQGPLRGVRRLASRLTRSAWGRTDGDAGEQRQQQQQGSQLGQTAAGKDARESASTHVGNSTGEQTPPACWHMRGRLTNAATGQTIALVEGVELSRNLAFETAQSEREKRRKQKKETELGTRGAKADKGEGVLEEAGEELEVDKALRPGKWTAFGSLASKKFFMYQDPETGDPMEHFRNTPVEKKQVVRTYERFSQIVSHLLQPNGRVLVISEWGGRSVKAETANSNGVEEMGEDGGNGFFGGGGLMKGRGTSGRSSPPSSSPRRVFNLHFFVEARTPKEERELKRWLDRPGARWIAFGSPPPPAHGCKEAYSYVSGGADGDETKPTRGKGKNRSAAAAAAAGGGGDGGGGPGSPSSSSRGTGGLMSYTRYGECPTWYGTGRMCGLDVQAKRVDSFESLPARLREKVRELDPEFEAGPPATMEECRLAARKEREDREEDSRRRGKRSLRRPFGSWGTSGGD